MAYNFNQELLVESRSSENFFLSDMRNKFTSGCRNIEHNSPKIENNTINKVLETDGLEKSNIRDDAFNEMDIKDSSVYELNLETDTEAEVEFGVDIYKSRKNSVSNNLTTENIKKEKRAGTENKENRGKEINWSRGTTLVCKGTESEKGYRGAKPVEKGKEGTSKKESSKKEKDDVDFLDIEKKASPKIRRGHTLSPKRNSNCDLSIESIGKDSPMTNLKRRSYSLHSPESSTGNRSTDPKTARVLSGQEKVKTRGKRSDKTYDLSQQVVEEDKSTENKIKSVKRKYVMREILKTEEDYVADLTLLEIYFIKPLISKKIISPKQINSIIRNIRLITKLHQKLANILEKAGDNVYEMAKGMESVVSDFGLYVEYCTNHNGCICVLESLKKNAEWTLFLMEFQSIVNHRYGNKRLELSDYLIKPIQRICKYPLFLRELISYSEKDQPENKILNAVLVSLTDACEKINTAQKKQDLMELTSRYIGMYKDNEYLPIKLVKKLGDILLSGTLDVLNYDQTSLKVKSYGCVLFKRFFIVNRIKKANQYEPKYWFPLHTMNVQVIYHNGENPAWSWRLVHINTHQYMDFSSYSTTENELWYEKISACIEESKKRVNKIKRRGKYSEPMARNSSNMLRGMDKKSHNYLIPYIETSSQSSGEHGQKTSEEGSPIQVEPRSTKLTAAEYTRSETSPDINDIKLFSFLKTQNNQSSNGFPNQLRSIKSSIAVSGIKREIVEKRFQHTTSTEILSCRAFSKMNNQEAKSSPLLRTSGVEIKHVDSQAAINSSRKGSDSSFLNKKTILNNQNLGEGNTRQFDDFKTQNSKLTHHDDTEKNLINQKSSFAFSKDKDGGNLVAPLDDDTAQKDINDISKYLPPSERFTRPQTQHGHPGYGRSPHMNIFNSTKELYHNAILSIVEKKNMLESFAQHAKTPTLKSKKDIPIKRCYSKGDYQNDAYQRIDAQFSINNCDAGHIRGIQHVYPGGNTEVDIPEYKLPNSYTVEYKKLSESQKSIKSTLTRPNVSTTKSESVKHSRQATNTNKADIHSAPFKSPKATALKHLRKSSKDEVVVYSTEELETEGGQVTERRKSWAVSSVGNGKLLRRQDSKTETLADAQKEWKEKSSKFLVVLEKLSLSKRKT